MNLLETMEESVAIRRGKHLRSRTLGRRAPKFVGAGISSGQEQVFHRVHDGEQPVQREVSDLRAPSLEGDLCRSFGFVRQLDPGQGAFRGLDVGSAADY